MGLQWKFTDAAMASPWRQRRMCILVAELPVPAALRTISGAEAFLETNARPQLGSYVELRHPEAGTISGTVRAHAPDGIALSLDCSERSVAFALAAITADMSRPEA
ncbi:MAG TPA: hypothetical protein VGD10_00835 [Allosphingosinicella sp.]|uniref:hypothetical protein n=1 Tax=Allosphingosinicella sp. TaxID=2823234 RepID=UPI002EDB30FA